MAKERYEDFGQRSPGRIVSAVRVKSRNRMFETQSEHLERAHSRP